MNMQHIPVLLKEVIQYLKPRPNADFIDCTVGEAGHAFEILKKTAPSGKLLAIDWDSKAIEKAKKRLKRFGKRVVFVRQNFINLKKTALEYGFEQVVGVLFDLGLATFQIKDPSYGLSFQIDGPLDMRVVPEAKITAYDIVNFWDFKKLCEIFSEFGDEPYAGSIAKTIIAERKENRISRTIQLAKIIKKAVPPRRFYRINPATRIFQALRIVVNSELENLKIALPSAADLLQENGKIAVISFHSGEDRIVKNFFKSRADLKILTKKPLVPAEQEIRRNPRARSAKLRVAEKD